MPSFVANFWQFIGKEGAQFLYLGIGTILAAAGVFLLIKSYFWGAAVAGRMPK